MQIYRLLVLFSYLVFRHGAFILHVTEIWRLVDPRYLHCQVLGLALEHSVLVKGLNFNFVNCSGSEEIKIWII